MGNCPDSNYEPITATIVQIPIVKLIIGQTLFIVQIMCTNNSDMFVEVDRPS